MIGSVLSVLELTAKNRCRAALAILGLLTSFSVAGHEFWLWPEPFSPAAGSSVRLSLRVGENFEGERIGFTAGNSVAFRHYALAQSQDLQDRLPRATALAEIMLTVPRAGAHLITYDSQPSQITLSADKFHAYLHDEGLDAIIKQREAAGTAGTPGREHYRRHVKTLLRVGGKTDATYALLTGQRLEIVPITDPLAGAAGKTLHFRLNFDGKPLVNALIKAWCKRGEQTVIIKTRTGEQGKFSLSLPYAGPWMISVVHMIPATDSADADWDSFWGNLTFELPAGKR